MGESGARTGCYDYDARGRRGGEVDVDQRRCRALQGFSVRGKEMVLSFFGML